MSNNPFETISSMSVFDVWDKEILAYMVQIFGLTKEIPTEVRKDLENMKEPDMIHILGSVLDSSKKTNLNVGKALEDIVNYAQKIIRNEKVNDKIYYHARSKLFAKIKRLHFEAGFSMDDRLYKSFGARILKQIESAQKSQDFKDRSVPLGKPK